MTPRSPKRPRRPDAPLRRRLAALEARVTLLETGRVGPGDGRASVGERRKLVVRCPGCGLPLRRRAGRCLACGRPLDEP